MSPQNQNKIILLFFFTLFCEVAAGKSLPGDKETVLKGRFVAQAENNLEDVGSFIGYAQLYVFEIEKTHKLVKISYTFRNINDQLSPEYLNYDTVHSFTVIRDSLCDDSLQHMAYTQGFDEKGHPVERQFTLKAAKGAPKLEITSQQLPCYMLRPAGLKK